MAQSERYKEFTQNERGPLVCFPNIQNIFFKPLSEPDYFVEPWENREVRDCSIFRRTTTDGSEKLELFFCTGGPKLLESLQNGENEMFLYGAYNQVTVCQMRVKGVVKPVHNHRDRMDIRRLLGLKIHGGQTDDPLKDNDLNEDELRARLLTLAVCDLFHFEPQEYAWSSYERG